MNTRNTRVLAMILAAGGMLAAWNTPAPAAAPATPAPAAAAPAGSTIAVVNIVDLFDKLLEKTAADTDLANMKKKATEDIAAKNADIDKQKQALDTYKIGTAPYDDAQDKLLQMTIDLNVFTQVSDAKYQREQMLRTAALYKKINDAIADYAREKGIGLVFVADVVDMSNVRTPEALTAVVTTRKLLYFDTRYDITADLVTRMNTAYQLKK